MSQMPAYMNPQMPSFTPSVPPQGYPFQGYAPQLPQGYTSQPYPQPQSYQMPAFQPPAPGNQPQGFDLNAWAQSQGVDVEQLGGPEAFLSSLMAGVDRATELERQLQGLSQQQAQQPQAPQGDSDWRQFESYMVRDDSGRVVAKPGAEYIVPVGYLNAANEELQQQQTRIQNLLTKPQEYFQQEMGPYIQEQIAKGIREQQERSARDENIRKFMEQNASVIYQVDANGKPTDTPSERGQRLHQIAVELQQDGVAPDRILERATQLFKMEMLEEQQQMRTQQQQMWDQVNRLQQDPQRMQAAYQHLQQMGMAPPQQQMQQPAPQQMPQQPAPQQQMPQQQMPQQQMPQQQMPQQQLSQQQQQELWQRMQQQQGPPALQQQQQQPQRYQPTENKFPWQQPDPLAPQQQQQPQQQMQQAPQQFPWQAPQQQPQPQQQNFLQDNNLSPSGSNGAWNTNERYESPLTDDDVDADVESILTAALEQQGLG